MDEIKLKRSEQDYYVSSDIEESTDSDDPQNIKVVTHRIEKGDISFVFKRDGIKSTQTLPMEDIDSKPYINAVSDFIKQKAKKNFDKYKSKKQLKLIKGCKNVKNEIKYVVVFMDGHEETISSFEMKQNFPNELLCYLEKRAFSSED